VVNLKNINTQNKAKITDNKGVFKTCKTKDSKSDKIEGRGLVTMRKKKRISEEFKTKQDNKRINRIARKINNMYIAGA
jgi:hypothetical protein